MFPRYLSRATALAVCASAATAGAALAAPTATTSTPNDHAPAQASAPATPPDQAPVHSAGLTSPAPAQAAGSGTRAPAQPSAPSTHAPAAPTTPTTHAPAKPATPTKHHPTKATKPTNLWTVTWTARAGAAPIVDPSSCTTPTLTQPFLAWHDRSEYTLAPGQSVDDFAGTGWILGRGASLETRTLADGHSGSVLDLPVGGYAISPPTCVETDYPTARAMVQTKGTAHVGTGVFYAARSTHSLRVSGVLRGSGSGFTLSRPFQVHPGRLPGWQMVQFVFGAAGTRGDAQIYNFYVDPRMLR